MALGMSGEARGGPNLLRWRSRDLKVSLNEGFGSRSSETPAGSLVPAASCLSRALNFCSDALPGRESSQEWKQFFSSAKRCD